MAHAPPSIPPLRPSLGLGSPCGPRTSMPCRRRGTLPAESLVGLEADPDVKPDEEAEMGHGDVAAIIHKYSLLRESSRRHVINRKMEAQ